LSIIFLMREKEISIFIINHGCKLNQYEGEALESAFRQSGFRTAGFSSCESPDITIVNTCTVTSRSDRKCRQSIYRALSRKKKGGLVLVTGCYAQTDQQKLSSIEGVDLVVGNDRKALIPEIVREFIKKGEISEKANVEYEHENRFEYSGPCALSRSRAYVKVQDGCDMYCSYCKVPLARGKSVSRDPEKVLNYIREIIDNGYREIVLTGINLGSYNYKGLRLSALIRKILEIGRELRVRLSSIEPVFFSEDLIEVIEHNQIMPHFHIPLQSGSDRVLKRMLRPYTVEEYRNLVENIRNKKPDAHLATDIIVGFPGERDEDFDKTLMKVEELKFASVHVFKYSPRNGTRAFNFYDDIPRSKKVSRSKKIISVASRLNYLYRKQFLGDKRDAVIEGKGNTLIATTDNYIKVKIRNLYNDLQCKEDKIQKSFSYENISSGFKVGVNKKDIVPVRITEVLDKETRGEIEI